VAVRTRRITATTLLAAAVLVLLPVLATLQYRWLGQVSENERTRLQRALINATAGIARDLDTELSRAVNRLELRRLTMRPALPAAGEPDASGTTADPSRLIQEILYVERAGDASRDLAVSRCDLDSLLCAPSQWPTALAPLGRDLARLFRHGDQRDAEELSRLVRGQSAPQPVIVVPVAGDGQSRGRRERGDRGTAAALLLLDVKHLRNELIPALVERHFGPVETSDFRVAIVDRELPLDVVYGADDGSLDDLLKDPEAWQELFTLRAEEFSARGSRDEGGLSSGAGSVQVFGRDGDDDDEEWMLVARHRDGSLQAAVDNLRRRNLLLSSGILALMGVAVGLIAVTSRRAQRLAEQQVEFVAGVSHELRTPVSAIHLAAQNLADGMVADPSRIRRYGATIQAESQRLRETVERVLQFAALSGRHPTPPKSAVAVGPLIDEVVASAHRDHPGAAITTAVSPELPTVVADPAGITVCLQNLLANALKYGGRSPSVRIAAAAGQGRRGPELQLSVEDNGPGIEPSDLPHIFDSFYRGRNALERRIQGNGLGLHIVKRIAADHGGRVTAVSAPGHGATLTLHIPLGTTPTAAPTPGTVRKASTG
jgi:signal transduction histidine kinase